MRIPSAAPLEVEELKRYLVIVGTYFCYAVAGRMDISGSDLVAAANEAMS